MTWFDKIKTDLNHIPAAIKHFNTEFEIAKKETSLKGNLERNSRDIPGIVAHRFAQVQEIEAILEYLNIEQKNVHRKHFKKYLTQYAQSLSSRDAEKFADGEPEVVSMTHLVNEWALIRNKWLGIIKSLDVKGWQISNITRLRTHGLDDVSL